MRPRIGVTLACLGLAMTTAAAWLYPWLAVRCYARERHPDPDELSSMSISFGRLRLLDGYGTLLYTVSTTTRSDGTTSREDVEFFLWGRPPNRTSDYLGMVDLAR